MAESEADADLVRRIAEQGPVSLARYMAAANRRFYSAADPLGEGGHFITAPEISQMFGELIGLWATDLCGRARRSDAAYVELGPGRGTLASDALRAARQHGWRPQVHFVETGEPFRTRLAATFDKAVLHESIDGLPDDRPLIVIANEFFDALPVHQYKCTPDGWRERLVAHDEAHGLHIVTGTDECEAFIPRALRDAAPGSLFEAGHASAAIMVPLARRVASQGGAILIVDYGHAEHAHGDTLQAVRNHEPVDILSSPGEADLTAHVDFAGLAAAGSAAGLHYAGPTTQGAFLGALGIGPRAASLIKANPDVEEDVQAALTRLTSPGEMGELFKAMALYAPDWPDPAGF